MWAPVSITLHYGITYNHLHIRVFYARHQDMEPAAPTKLLLTWLRPPLENIAIEGIIGILRHPILIQLSGGTYNQLDTKAT